MRRNIMYEPKIRIDDEGVLYIWRVNQWKKQKCRFSQDAYFCGDTCPHFSEPYESTGEVVLYLCNDTIWTVKSENFVDERVKNET